MERKNKNFERYKPKISKGGVYVAEFTFNTEGQGYLINSERYLPRILEAPFIRDPKVIENLINSVFEYGNVILKKQGSMPRVIKAETWNGLEAVLVYGEE